MPWLEECGIEVIRERVESIDKSIFRDLKENDLLFIDSSHVIRPQGDVVTEYLEILPMLSSGVIVHIHDIFTPRDYPEEWVLDEVRLWNEQYLLEAFLTFNSRFEILFANNYMWHEHCPEMGRKCPKLREHGDANPSSMYLRVKC